MGKSAHVVTIWGVDTIQTVNLTGVYFQTLMMMKPMECSVYSVINKDEKAFVTTADNGSEFSFLHPRLFLSEMLRGINFLAQQTELKYFGRNEFYI